MAKLCVRTIRLKSFTIFAWILAMLVCLTTFLIFTTLPLNMESEHLKPTKRREPLNHLTEKWYPLTTSRGINYGNTATDSEIFMSRKSCCQPWPLPRVFVQNKSQVYLVDHHNFYFDVTPSHRDCVVIRAVLERYKNKLRREIFNVVRRRNETISIIQDQKCLRKLTLTVQQCQQTLSLQTDESYILEVAEGDARLKVREVTGMLRGLETFTQLLGREGRGQVYLYAVYIKDYPRFPHRGLMLDTGRHYLDIPSIKQTLDAMERNKMNVFHWHLTDDQSFPVHLKSYPHLSKQGAFSSDEVYRHTDIQEVIEYARLRGIRVIPEIDTPGHTLSWQWISHGLLDRQCSTDRMGLLNLTSDMTFTVLENVLREISSVFPTSALHLGGDEIPVQCGSGDDVTATGPFVRKYFHRLQELVHSIAGGVDMIVWSDVLQSDVTLDPGTIVHVWNENSISHVINAVTLGHRTLYSVGWYLDRLADDWQDFYMRDPGDLIPDSSSYADSLVGGEACMWGEQVDTNNLLQTAWPRAAAVAERLWSDPTIRDPQDAMGRLTLHRCRMVRSGIPVGPISPGSCAMFDV